MRSREVFREHLEQTKEHRQLVDQRLAAHGAGPSRFQAGAMRAGALNLGMFFKAQPDTPVKLAGFAYAFEALEVGAYELLTRVAERAGDEQTAASPSASSPTSALPPNGWPAPGTRPSKPA